MSNLTQEKLKSIIRYNPDTGEFIYLVTINPRAKKGSKFNVSGNSKYATIQIAKKKYQLGHIAVLYMTGKLPATNEVVDHIDTNTQNYKWSNLRLCNEQQNSLNRRLGSRPSSTGIKGVTFYPERVTPYRARVQKDGKTHTIYCSSLEEAAITVKQLRDKIHGNFANHN